MNILYLNFGSRVPEVPALIVNEGAPGGGGPFTCQAYGMVEIYDACDAVVVPYVYGEETQAFVAWATLEMRWRENCGALPVILPYGVGPAESELDEVQAAFDIADLGKSSIEMRPRVLPPVLPWLPPDVFNRIRKTKSLEGMPLLGVLGQRLYTMLEELLNDPDADRETYAYYWCDIGRRLPLSPYDGVTTVQRLADDLLRFHGSGPDAETLRKAPRLEHWRQSARPEYVLEGTVFDHPLLGDCREARTSILFRIDPEAGWARTLNRLYRLGTPLSDEPITHH